MVTIAALLFGLPIGAAAQADQGASTTTTAVQTQTTTTTTSLITQDPESHWMASGFVGSNFAMNADPASTEFGGSVGYLWKSRFGAEFDTGFTPNFELQNNFLGLGVTPMINSYMANAIGALPLGPDAQWLPFISIGAGAISLRSDVTEPISGDVFETNATRFGGNVGAGLMGFLGNWGFKADVRYLRASGQYSNASLTGATPPSGPTPGTAPAPTPGAGPAPTPAPGAPAPTPGGPTPFPYSTTSAIAGPMTSATVEDDPRATAFANNVLSGLAFWRANFGVALRW
jgi:hypothetical protein